VSCTILNVTIALPIGVAVWLTLSLTSYAVILIFVSVVNPSLARKLTVVKKFGLLLRWNKKHKKILTNSTIAQLKEQFSRIFRSYLYDFRSCVLDPSFRRFRLYIYL